MSSGHSKLWQSKKSSLGEKESRLENELESVSSAFEGQAKKILIGVAIVGIAAFAVGMAISASKKKKDSTKEKKKEKPNKEKEVAKSSVSVKTMLLEKIAATALSLLLTQLGNYLKSTKDKNQNKD